METVEDMRRALKDAGVLSASDGEPVAERRGDRAMVALPGERLAWFPLTEAAAQDLRTENRVLGLVGERCRFDVPAVLFVAPCGWTLRSKVPGAVDPNGLAGRLKADPDLLRRTADTLGIWLADLHRSLAPGDVAEWLPRTPPWPLPDDVIRRNIRAVIGDPGLIARVERALAGGEALRASLADPVLVQADLGFHNVAFDPETGALNGLFDFGSAARADRHLDFRYLVFGAIPDALLDATIARYTALSGATLDRRRILLGNALAAISHLADRMGNAPDAVVAGRTEAQDLVWTRWALGRAGF